MNRIYKHPPLNRFSAHRATGSGAGHSPIVIAIGSGKGGVGKSFVSSSIAICLARMAYQVTVVDLDLGGANIHTYFGNTGHNLSVSDFLKNRVENFQDLAYDTNIRNLKVVNGFSDSLDSAEISENERQKLMRAIRSLSTDVVILDLGAGTANSTLDFFIEADKSMLVLTPEPTAVENAYRFLKSSYYRKLRNSETDAGAQKLIEEAMDQKNNLGIRSPADLLSYLEANGHRESQQFLNRVRGMDVGILLNQVRAGKDIDTGRGVASISQRYFGIPIQYIGHVAYDNAVWQSLRKKTPFIIDNPSSPINNQFLAIAKLILGPSTQKAVV
ncbi:MAG: MinD/ParA family protein [Bdellovibrionales bacterium]